MKRKKNKNEEMEGVFCKYEIKEGLNGIDHERSSRLSRLLHSSLPKLTTVYFSDNSRRFQFKVPKPKASLT